MKKGFTLIEMVIVVAILGILLSIAYINFTRANCLAEVDRATNEIAAMLRDMYEYGNKELDYDKYSLEFQTTSNELNITMKKNSTDEIRSAKFKNIEIKINGTSIINGIVKFNSDGKTKLDGTDFSEIKVKHKSYSNEKTITIYTISQGTIKVE
ncbi:MAG: prepilin-type N-terminal cleavage/methylation domain-containing protein [Endomicrobia bacterium]|nr:prepilin-type N-terminal cleavage/methylation domain-containing protein [Endomicrobiia bacterium]